MDQISLPMRIALAAILAFAALWFVALKPKPVDVDAPLPSAPAQRQSAPTKTPDASTPAKATKAAASATGAAAATSEPVAKATEAAAEREPAAKRTGSKAVLADVEAGRTVVLLFYHPAADSADDIAVRAAVRRIDRHGGKVRVHAATLGKLAQYEAITKTARITNTPTVLVIDRQAQVRSIEGLTVTREIDAVVDRALKVK